MLELHPKINLPLIGHELVLVQLGAHYQHYMKSIVATHTLTPSKTAADFTVLN